MLVWKNEVSSLRSLAVSDSLRSCTLRLVNEFALLTSLLVGLATASCSHDYAYARVVGLIESRRSGVRYAHEERTIGRAAGLSESGVCGLETLSDVRNLQANPSMAGAITPHEFRGAECY